MPDDEGFLPTPDRRQPVQPTNIPPTTTAAEDRSTLRTDDALAKKAEGQREINMIWEQTQMKVALSVVWSSLIVSITLGIFGKWLGQPDMQLAALVFIFGVANLVTGFYFGRTNHTKTGGVGGASAGDR